MHLVTPKCISIQRTICGRFSEWIAYKTAKELHRCDKVLLHWRGEILIFTLEGGWLQCDCAKQFMSTLYEDFERGRGEVFVLTVV